MGETHRHYFNRLATAWENRMPPQPEFRLFLAQFGVRPGERILDVGCGTGRMARLLAEVVGENGSVIAHDVAERMLYEAWRMDGGGRIRYVCNDVHALSIKGEVFDKVLCFSAFPHFHDPLQALREMWRVLKPWGRLLILHTTSSERLNAFHAGLSGPVQQDRLPSVHTMGRLFMAVGFRILCLEENDRLYWAEAQRPGDSLKSPRPDAFLS